MPFDRFRTARSRATTCWAGLLILGFVGAAGCAPSDDERCRAGWQYTDNTCVPIDEGDTTSSQAEGTDTDLPEGLGRQCTPKAGECEGLEASYCVQDPRKLKGYCSVPDCQTLPDDCPDGYRCCVFIIESEPSFCATEADVIEMGGLCQE